MSKKTIAVGARIPISFIPTLDKRAEKICGSRSEYLRTLMLLEPQIIDAKNEPFDLNTQKIALPLFTKNEITSVNKELIAQGNNLNQCAKSINYLKNNLGSLNTSSVQSLLGSILEELRIANDLRWETLDEIKKIKERINERGF